MNALATENLAVSRLVWQTMCRLPVMYLTATYQKSAARGHHESPSQLVHHLRNSAWVPQGGGDFVYPADARRECLPAGFAFDPGAEWLKRIQFGENHRQRSEETAKREALAKEAGFLSLDRLEQAKKFDALPQSIREAFLAAHTDDPTRLPERSARNPTRRAEAVELAALEAPGRISEERTRAVQLGTVEVAQRAKEYLRDQYTQDGETICQICKEALPFRLPDGKYYFEAIGFLPTLKDRHYQNFLCLCPNHSAMFQWANGSREQLKALLVARKGSEVAVQLANRHHSVYFTEVHIADLLAVIRADEKKTASHTVVGS